MTLDECPDISSKVDVFHSAVAVFYAPSDISGVRGLRQERLRSHPSWHGHPRRDCAFAVEDQSQPGFCGMSSVRILLFFSFFHEDVRYECALVEWFKTQGEAPDELTGMWIVKPDYEHNHRLISVIPLDSLLRSAHLIPVFGPNPLPKQFKYFHSLDWFNAFYVSKYADHHSHEIAF